MYERVYHMLIKEFIQIFRDPRMRMILFIVPVLQTLVFGYALTTDVKHIRMAVYDLDRSVHSRALISSFSESGYFDVVANIDTYADATKLMDDGTVQMVLHLDQNYSKDLLSGQSVPIQVFIDGTDANTASIINTYVSSIVQRQSNKLLDTRLRLQNPIKEQLAGINLQSRAWFNQNLESRNFYVPGVVATLLTLVTLTLTSMAIVREKEIGTMEQILVTPITPKEFILGKTVPFIIIAFVDVFAILLVAVFWFEVPIKGSLTLLLFAASLYLLTTLGIGLLISTICQTQQQAMMSAFLFYFPIALLSGFIFPIANMPDVIQGLTYLNPLKYFIVIIRGVFLKGIGLEILWPEIVCLGVMGAFILWFATTRFHKTMA